MALQHEHRPEPRRFLVINFRVGTNEGTYLVGPVLVSTRDYRRFHFWDEPSAAVLGEHDYEVVKAYRPGLTYDQVTRQFAKDFPPTIAEACHSAAWSGMDGTFDSAEVWAAPRWIHVAAA